MKKFKKVFIGLMAAIMLTGSILTVNAGCGGCTVNKVVNQYCATPGCNQDRALWMYVVYEHVRECRSEYGTEYTEYKTETINPGCC